jgi:alcohol dehydrogenase, propanol-preferring
MQGGFHASQVIRATGPATTETTDAALWRTGVPRSSGLDCAPGGWPREVTVKQTMRAMLLERPGTPLRAVTLPVPEPGPGQVRVRVRACAVCRTDLHVVDGELEGAKLPLVPGHEIAGEVDATGAGAGRFQPGERVGVAWLGWTCGERAFCRSGRENLCDRARFTGYTLDGGYAGYVIADERYCFALPPGFGDVAAAPLMCAGLIGYRSLVKAGDAKRLGIYGFGAAAHLVAQVALWQGREVYAFTRPGDEAAQRFARGLGATWAGGSDERPPVELDAAILFAPVGALVPLALRAVARGGTVVCGGIHMSDIPSFPYELIWQERTVCSVANLTRRDGEEFLALAARVPVRAATETFPLEQANEALTRLREGRLQGAAVLVPGD